MITVYLWADRCGVLVACSCKGWWMWKCNLLPRRQYKKTFFSTESQKWPECHLIRCKRCPGFELFTWLVSALGQQQLMFLPNLMPNPLQPHYPLLSWHLLFFLSACGMNVHHKCQTKVANLCGVNQKLMAEALAMIESTQQVNTFKLWVTQRKENQLFNVCFSARNKGIEWGTVGNKFKAKNRKWILHGIGS